MAQLIYSTKLSESGPWLLDAAALTELDNVLGAEWERLGKREEQWIQDRVAARLGGMPRKLTPELEAKEQADALRSARELAADRRYRSLMLRLPGDHKLAVSTFQEAAQHPEMAKQGAQGFELSLQRADVKLSVSLNNRWSNRLEVTAEPPALDDARDLFGAVYNWSRGVEPPLWQKVWAGADFVVWALWMIYMFLVLSIAASTLQASSKAALKEEAHALIRKGVTPANQAKATELTLAIVSEYPVPAERSRLSGRWWCIIVIGLLVCIAVSIRPRNVIGLGKGAAKIHRWRLWMRFAGVTVPVTILGSIVWPFAVTVFQSLWRS